MQAIADFLNVQSQANQSANRKLEKFNKLSAAMKKQIKLAQVDCSDDLIKLVEINWGPKATPSAAQSAFSTDKPEAGRYRGQYGIFKLGASPHENAADL